MENRTRPHRFVELLQQRATAGSVVILDGAVGTELDNRGANTHAATWTALASLDSPSLLSRIHREYVSAGADIITANTFRTTRHAFERAGIGGEAWRDAARSAVRLAREAAGEAALVAGSVAPLEDCFSPHDAPAYRAAYEAHRMLCTVLVDAGVDILWLETFGTIEEARAAVDAANASSDGQVPVAVSFTTKKDGALISGESLADASVLMAESGVAAISVNCIPWTHVSPALAILEQSTRLPIGVYANLGIPEESQDWEGSAYLSPDVYAEMAKEWGARLIGGCCGSTPAHIKALSDAFVRP